MSTDLLRTGQTAIAISLIATLFVLVAACGGDAEAPAAGDEPTAVVDLPTVVPTSVPTIALAATTKSDPVTAATATAAPAAMPTEPVLINTPVPVANLAPDFTLPSIQGSEYTLSSFRGTQPVIVVFYRAYW